MLHENLEVALEKSCAPRVGARRRWMVQEMRGGLKEEGLGLRAEG
jgi:hypothetical protein